MNLTKDQLEYYMKQALALASRATGQTSPNPLVGCILLDSEYNIIAQDYHKKAGEAHAEALVLEQAGDKAQGGILFVTLEPCAHTGQTPPCVDKIINSQVQTVIIGTQDPNPLVNGQGIQKLQDNNIQVIIGVCEQECRELNKEFFHWVKNKKPWVTLKIAGSLNSKITSNHKFITSDKARQDVHRLRAEHDAILTTCETVIQDNCLLTVRNTENTVKQPIRVILDRNSKLTPEFNIFQDNISPVLLFTQAQSKYTSDFPEHVEIIKYSGEFNEVLEILAQRNILSVMLETGSKFNSYILENNLFNELIYYINPESIVGSDYLSFYKGNKSLDLQLEKYQVINNNEFVYYLRPKL